MKFILKWFFVFLWFSGFLLVSTGFLLSRSPLSGLASFLSESENSNEKILEKTHLLPHVFILLGLEILIFGFISLIYRKTFRNLLLNFFSRVNLRQTIVLILFTAYSSIAALALNFGAVNLVNRQMAFKHRSRMEILAADFGEEFQVVQALRQQTPESSSILIRTKRPLKYLLNYELHPRRFYFYGDP